MLSNQDIDYIRRAFDAAAKNSSDTLAVSAVLSEIFQKILEMRNDAQPKAEL